LVESVPTKQLKLENATSQLSETNLKIFPNPFYSSTTIQFELDKWDIVNVSVFNQMGKLVKVLLNNSKQAEGSHNLTFEMSNLASGIYWVRLRTQDTLISKKMVLMNDKKYN